MGSDSDWPVMEAAAAVLAEFEVPFEADVVSAHRMPNEMISYGSGAAARGLRVIIAGAGGGARPQAMLAAIDAGHGGWPGGSRAKLVAARKYLEAALPVVEVAKDAPVPDADGSLPARPPDPAALAALDARWDLGGSLGRMMSALAVRSGSRR